MSFGQFLLATVLACYFIPGQGQSSTCPVFGTDESSRLSRSREERIFMNFESPAQCRGNVTGWRFCYYRNVDDEDDIEDISSSRIFAALFIVYRRQSATSNNYIPVPGSVREKQIQWRNIRGSRFQCMDEGLSSNEYFEIQENDVVGACIKDVESIDPLLLVGTSSGSNFLTYQWDESGYDDCLTSQYSSVDTSHNDFRQRSTSTLHLYANIAVTASCIAGSNIAPAVAVTSGLSGTYLNVESPVLCNNHITKWHYCYYPQAATPGSTLSMTVAVWSLDVATNTYIVNPSSIKTITLQPVQTLAKIFCIEESLDENEFVLVSQNDLIGVSLPSSNAIPILGSNANPSISIKRHSTTQPSNFINSELTAVGSSVLHIYATIVFQDLPTTLPETTMEPTEEVTTSLHPMTSESTTSVTTSSTDMPISTSRPVVQTLVSTQPNTEIPTSMQPGTEIIASTEPRTEIPMSTEPETEIPMSTEPETEISMSTEPETEIPMSTEPETEIPMSTEPETEIPMSTEPETEIPMSTQPETEISMSTEPETEIPMSTEPETEIPMSTEPETEIIMSTETTMATQQTSETKAQFPTEMFTQHEAADATETHRNDPTTSPTGLGEEAGQQYKLGGGDITAIILSLLVVTGVVALMTLLFLYIKRRRGKYSIMHRKEGFDNVIYDAGPGLKDKERVTIYDSIVEPYIYSDDQTILRSQLCNNDSTNEYQIIEDYYTPMNDASAYQQELEQVRRGSTLRSEGSIYSDPGNNEEEIYSFLKNKKIQNIPENTITMGSIIGSGHFGTVYEGEWQPKKEFVNVALKSFKEHGSSSDKVKFLQEAAIMAQFHHPNVVSLYGVTNKDGIMMLVVEYLAKGDLHQYLDTLMPDPGELVPASTSNLLLQFSQQISLGMSYLTSTGFIHRDLAARNVLISHSMICKIADFGMSRNLHDDEDYYTASGGKIPLKWTAPEAIHYKKFSAASDVWSYGCVLYEIWSVGHKPFEQISNMEVIQVVDSGGRLAPPPGCPRLIYQLMMKCWNPKPRDRPKFRDIILSLLDNEEVVLNIPLDVTNIHPLAATLGAPLKAGFHLYKDLQTIYMTK